MRGDGSVGIGSTATKRRRGRALIASSSDEFEEEQERQRLNTEERRERYRKIRLAKFESSQREEAMRRRIENAICSSSSLGWRDLISQRDELSRQSRISGLGTVEDAVMKSMDELLLIRKSIGGKD